MFVKCVMTRPICWTLLDHLMWHASMVDSISGIDAICADVQVFATGPSDADGIMHVKRYTLNGYDTAVPESEVADDFVDEEDEDAVCRPLEI